MNTKYQSFRKFVTIIVTLTGAIFGTWAGTLYVYRDNLHFFFIGTILGIIGGYAAAKIYLHFLEKISIQFKKFVTWLITTLIAALCGILCTTFIHVIMLSATAIITGKPLTPQGVEFGFLLLFILIAHLIGACFGLLIGGMCSLVYLKSIKADNNETINPA